MRRVALLMFVAMVILFAAAPRASAARPEAPPAAVPPRLHSVSVAQFNLAGWTLNNGSLAPAERVVATVIAANPRPLIVTMNEMCSSALPWLRGQWQRISDALAALGYDVLFAPTKHWVGSRCELFGNGLAVLGSAAGPQLHTFSSQWPGSSERRNILCTRASTAAGPLTACVTHLVPKPEGPDQADEALRFVHAQTQDDEAHIVGGDFNLPPDHTALDRWYASHQEADHRHAKQPTMDRGGAADYVFAATTVFEPASSRVVTAVAESDHHWQAARFGGA